MISEYFIWLKASWEISLPDNLFLILDSTEVFQFVAHCSVVKMMDQATLKTMLGTSIMEWTADVSWESVQKMGRDVYNVFS